MINDQSHWVKSRELIDRFIANRDPSDQITDCDPVDAVESDLDNCVYISAYDVAYSTRRTRGRTSERKPRKGREFRHTHRIRRKKAFHYCCRDAEPFSLLLAFLISNDLLADLNLISLSNVVQNIRSYIDSFFAFRKPQHKFVWHHLEKRMKEFLSMTVKGNMESKRVLRIFLRQYCGLGTLAKRYHIWKTFPKPA